MILTMYLTNKYTKWYESIIAHARCRVKPDGYFEKHHIIPKSLGGSNDDENLVNLTAKEHFICHRLLPKMTTGIASRSMAYAVWQMTMISGRARYKVTARTYDALKKQISKTRKGIPMSEEQKQKLRKPNPETRLKMSNARKAQTGLQKRSDETKAKMSSWQKGIPKDKVTCEHCGKESSQMNYSRWHGGNCKTLS